MTRFHSSPLVWCAWLGALGCSPTPVAPITDAAPADESATDAAVTDDADSRDVGGTSDATPTSDVASPSDVATTDAPAPRDVAATDAVSPVDAPAGADVPRPLDAPTISDVPTVTDVPRVTDAPAATDVIARPDVVTTADAGCAATTTLSFATPAADEEIETCSASESPVYYTFTARASGPVTGLRIDLRTPDGSLAPPPSPTFAAAPYSFRRQVGGRMIDVPPLAVFGIRGTWHAEATATDACGRTVRASQPFTLIYTTRRCPNP